MSHISAIFIIILYLQPLRVGVESAGTLRSCRLLTKAAIKYKIRTHQMRRKYLGSGTDNRCAGFI